MKLELSKQLEEWMIYLVEHGVRITPQRKFLLNLVLIINRPFSAMEMYKEMEKSFPGLSYGTVYRNLELYKSLNIIEVFILDLDLRYRLIDQVQPQLHYTCMNCKQTIPMSFNPQLMELPKPREFRSMKYKVDIFGYCTDCEH